MSNTTKGRHRAPTSINSKKTRRLAGIPILGWFTFAGAGVALAVWIILSGVSGTVNTATADVDYSQVTAPIIISGACTATVTGADEMAITWDSALGGDTCAIQPAMVPGDLVNGNDIAMALQGFTAPTGINATLGAWCGTELAAGQLTNLEIRVVLEVDEASTTFGDSFVFDALTHGFQWVAASQYDPLLCS